MFWRLNRYLKAAGGCLTGRRCLKNVLSLYLNWGVFFFLILENMYLAICKYISNLWSLRRYFMWKNSSHYCFLLIWLIQHDFEVQNSQSLTFFHNLLPSYLLPCHTCPSHPQWSGVSTMWKPSFERLHTLPRAMEGCDSDPTCFKITQWSYKVSIFFLHLKQKLQTLDHYNKCSDVAYGFFFSTPLHCLY